MTKGSFSVYDLITVGRNAKKAARVLRGSGSSARNAALFAMARALRTHRPEILEANRTDVEIARRGGCRTGVAERLTLTGSLIEAMAAELETITTLPDPIGATRFGGVRPNGLSVFCTRVPIGVVGVVSEACPAATVDAAALCIKSGNACILSGGKNAYGTNRVLVQWMRQAIGEVGLPPDAVCPVEDSSEETSRRLLKMNEYIDVLIPRGEPAFVRRVAEETTLPVLDTGRGCCCVYVDRAADLSMAVRIVDNAKTSAPEAVNSIESVLVHRDRAAEFLPKMKQALDLHGVRILGCPDTCRILPGASPAAAEDWNEDFRGYTLAVRVVDSLEEACAHMESHCGGVAVGIVTNDIAAAQRFAGMADAAAVFVNASTRFLDGGDFGLGAELGVAGQKLHVRGPIGLHALTTMKYIVTGSGQIR